MEHSRERLAAAHRGCPPSGEPLVNVAGLELNGPSSQVVVDQMRSVERALKVEHLGKL